MRFRVLGPVRVLDGERPVPVPSGRVRALLAALLLRANQLVTVPELTERLWGADPPADPRATVQTYVGRLRRAVGAGVVRTEPSGYLIDIDPDQLDLTCFRRLVERAGHTGDAAEQAELLGIALSLWHGPPLADVTAEPLVRDDAARLAEERLLTTEQWIDARLRAGEHAGLVAELVALTAEHPVRERFWAQLMLALHGSGRQAEALEAYHTIRRRLDDELGVAPGAALRETQQAVLGGQPDRPSAAPAAAGLAAPGAIVPVATVSVATVPGAAVPRQLPAAVRGFVGRAAELRRLDALRAEREPGTMPIAVIAGTAGVGKTALAVHWAHRAAEAFPDGQLWVNLRGYDPQHAVTPAQALATSLRALGMPSRDVPAETEARVGLYRSLLEGRRMLVVLDNAGDAEQVRPLLPGASGCTVLVTSRDDLSSLVARDGAVRVRVDPLDEADAEELLRRLLRPPATRAARAALADLARLCAGLPLALRIAAERVAGLGLGAAVTEMAGQPRLDALDTGGDPRTAVRAVFSWSYQAQPPAVRRLFRLLGLVPGTSWDASAAAALAGCQPPQARQLLNLLVAAHLAERHGDGRYEMHDLLRAYAAELAGAGEPDDRRDALTRLHDHYLHTAAAAMDAAFPHERHHRPRIDPQVTPFADPAAATAWLDAERPNLVAAVAHADRDGWPAHAVRLAATLARYLLTGAHSAEALAVHRHAGHAAEVAGDRAAEAVALRNLGIVCWQLGGYGEAHDHFQRALTIARELGDPAVEAPALNGLGNVYLQWGWYQRAYDCYRRTAALAGELGDRAGEATALNNVGRIQRLSGRRDEACEHYRRALEIRREIGDRVGEAYSLAELGRVDRELGRYEQALAHYQQSLEIRRQIGHRTGVATVLQAIGLVHLYTGHHEEAREHHRQALAIAAEIGSRDLEAMARGGLGEISNATGQPVEALSHHGAALRLAEGLGQPQAQARALDGMALAHRELGDHAAARRLWRQALDIYSRLGVPAAADIRARLAELADQPSRAGPRR